MGKYDYDDYLEEDPMFTPCLNCGCLDFYMDWDDSIYKCSDCHTPIDTKSQNNKRSKSKERLRKFKDYEE